MKGLCKLNKLKGSSAAVKMKYLLYVFAAAALVSLPTRVYQLLALIDPSNGFYTQSDVTIPVLYAVVVVFGLLFMVLSFISREVPSPKLPEGKNPVLGVASVIMAVGLGWDIVSIIKNTVPASQGSSEIFVSLFKSNLSESGGMFTVLQFIFAFFAIIYFLVFAISHLNGRASYKEFKLLALSPLCWCMTMLVSRLMNAISFIKVSELLFELFMCVFMMLFFLTFARISSGVFTEDSMWGIYGYGLVASLLGAIVTIPRVIVFAVGLEPVEGNEFNFAHLAGVIFILAYIFASLGVGFKDGVKNRRTVNEIDLPDDDVAVTKKDDSEGFAVAEDLDFSADDFSQEEETMEDVLSEFSDDTPEQSDDSTGELKLDLTDTIVISDLVEEAEEHEEQRESVSSGEGFKLELPAEVEDVQSFVTEEEAVADENIFSDVTELPVAEVEIPEEPADALEPIQEVEKPKTRKRTSKAVKKDKKIENNDDFAPISLAELKKRAENKEE